MDRDFLQSKDFEIRELKRLIPGSKEYKRKFQKLKVQMVSQIFKDFKQCSKDDKIYLYRKKHRINIFLCIIFMVVAFVLLGFSILSLGDKEPQDFTSAEMQEFILWMGSIFISLCTGMFFAIRAGCFISQYLTFLVENYEES